MNIDEVERIVRSALAVPPGAERAGFIQGACGDDQPLRREVERRLQAAAGSVPGPNPGLDGADTVDAVSEQPGTVIARYKLLERLGEGGYGEVWAAEQREPVKRRVALKIIKAGMDTRQVIARFEAERQALAIMDHPNIARILDAGTTQTGRPYFVMELVRGVPITNYCHDERVDTAARIRLLIAVCQAVQHAHQKGIIHRDLKPSNILVTLHDGVPVPKVIDFGIAKATQQELTEKTVYTRHHQFIGTPAYMSPEQAEMSGLDIDTRSDIYSLGVVLYELLAGLTPFDARELANASLDEMRRIIRDREPMRPSTRVRSMRSAAAPRPVAAAAPVSTPPIAIDRDLDCITMKCLEKDRSRRYETASALAADLQRYLDHEPVLARPPSLGYQLQKVWRRNRLPIAAAAALAATLVAATVFSLRQAIRAREAAAIALASRNEAVAAREAESLQRVAAMAAKDEAVTQRSRAEEYLYAANLRLMKQAWDNQELYRLRALLDETATHTDRGFEWYYWQAVANQELLELYGHLGPVYATAFSPDDARLVSADATGRILVWDATTGQKLYEIEGHAMAPTALAFLPNGSRFVSASFDKIVAVWDAADGRLVLRLPDHPGAVMALAVSPDGRRIATSCVDRRVRVWEATRGELLQTSPVQSSAIYSLAFHPNGRDLVCGRRSDVGWLRESGTLRDGELAFRAPAGQTHVCSAISPGVEAVACADWEGRVTIRRLSTGQAQCSFGLEGDRVFALGFSPDGSRIVTATASGAVVEWDAATGEEVARLGVHAYGPGGVAYSSDGRRIASGGNDWALRVWAARPLRESRRQLAHPGTASSAAYSADGSRIVTAGWDATARVFDRVTGKELHRLSGHHDRLWDVAISADARRVVTGSLDGTACIWDAAAGSRLQTLSGHRGVVLSVTLSPDGRLALTASDDGTVILWDTASGREWRRLPGQQGPVWDVAVAPGGRWCATANGTGGVRLWDLADGTGQATLQTGAFDARVVAIQPDSQRLAAGAAWGAVSVWNVGERRLLNLFTAHGTRVTAVAFSPDGTRLATGDAAGDTKLWKPESGQEVLRLAFGRPIRDLAFSPDGRDLLIAGDRPGVRVLHGDAPEVVERRTARRHQVVAAVEALARSRNEAEAKASGQGAEDPGAIKDWLILGPIPYPDPAADGLQALTSEEIPGEARLVPRSWERTRVGKGFQTWRPVHLEDYSVDLSAVLLEMVEYAVTYAVCYVESASRRPNVTLNVGSDDQAKVYLNGESVYASDHRRGLARDEDRVEGLTLNAGRNRLLVKVVNEGGMYGFSVHLTDPDGQPIPGIRVGLEP